MTDFTDATDAKPPLDLLHMAAIVSTEVVCRKVDISMQVTSSSAVRSSEAALAVAEIAELIAALTALGVDASKIEVQSADVAEGKGIFNRGSSATFHLLARGVDVDKLVGVLQEATRLPHVEHSHTAWNFDIEDDVYDDLISRASARARRRAEVAAEPLGARLGGVHTYHVSVSYDGDGSVDLPMGGASMAPRMLRKKSISSFQSSTGIELVKRLEISATAEVSFLLASAPGATE